MAHYRTIDIDGREFRYCVGRFVTKIDNVGLFDNHRIGKDYGDDKVGVHPSHVEKVIRRELGIPQREYDWDKPATKVDPGPKTRGFRDLVGAAICDVRVSAINEVILEDMDGTRYAIEADVDGTLRLPVIRLRVLKGNEVE